MAIRRLNLISAMAAFAAAVVWLALGQSWDAAAWLAAAVVWLVLAVVGTDRRVANAGSRLTRRLSRLLLWS